MARQYASAQPKGFKNQIEKIALVGAGGQIGKNILNALVAERKHQITAIGREGSNTTLPAAVTFTAVNYDDQATLVAALRGQDALIITMSVRAPPDTQEKLVNAAAVAGVPWIMPNEWGSDLTNSEVSNDIMIGVNQNKIRGLIKGLGKSSFVAISCGFWYEYSLSAHPVLYGFDIPNRAVTFYDDGNTPMNTTTRPLCGLAAARVLGLKIFPDNANDTSPCLDDYRNTSAYVSSFTLTQKQMLESVMQATGTTDSEWTISHESSAKRFADGQKELQSGDQMGFGKLLYARLFFPDGSGNFGATKPLANKALGLPKEDLDHWTKEAVRLSYEPSPFGSR